MNENHKKIIELFKEKTKKDCYKVSLTEEEPAILDDKIGGKPYLPVGEEWPKDKDGNELALLLQVNLKGIDLPGWPKEGILEIFTDRAVEWPCQYAVRYFAEGLEYQTELPEIDTSEYVIKTGCKITLAKDVCYMPYNDYRFAKAFTDAINEVAGTSLEANYASIDDYFTNDVDWYEMVFNDMPNPTITIGGYADFTQTDPRERRDDNKDECLFKIDSSENMRRIYIGDAGIMSAMISMADIENRNFGNALVDWDCC